MNAKILGKFTPSSLDHNTIKQELGDFLRKLGFELNYDSPQVRDPEFYADLGKFDIAYLWHQDGGGNRFLIVWSNLHPTKVRCKATGTELNVSDGDVVVLDNNEYEHCAPTNADCGERWFARAYSNTELNDNNEKGTIRNDYERKSDN